jgi:putative transposase
MKNAKSLYHGHRFPAAVISCAVRWYFLLQLCLRDIEQLLLELGVIVSYETIRRWCQKLARVLLNRVKAAGRKPGTTWHLDEVFVTLRREPYLLWRAVDQHGAELVFCCRSVATRPQPSGFSSACWPRVPKCHARS